MSMQDEAQFGYGTSGTTTGDTGSAGSTGGVQEKATEVAHRATEVASVAGEGARQVKSEVAGQVKGVAGEAKTQVSNLLSQTGNELRQQADQRGQQASQALRSLSGHFEKLASGQVEDSNPLLRYLDEGRTRIESFADRIEQRGPQGLLEDVTRFARRRPGAFLLAAAGAGMLAGRVLKANAAGAPESESYGYQGGYGMADMSTAYPASAAYGTSVAYDTGDASYGSGYTGETGGQYSTGSSDAYAVGSTFDAPVGDPLESPGASTTGYGQSGAV